MRRPAAGNGATPPRASDGTRAFYQDWTRLAQLGRYDLTRLKAVMLSLIANNAPLEPQWRDHALTGNWDGHRECHIGGDFLLAHLLSGDARATNEWTVEDACLAHRVGRPVRWAAKKDSLADKKPMYAEHADGPDVLDDRRPVVAAERP